MRRGTRSLAVRSVRAQRRISPSANAVALTFDDGPDPKHTTAILDELARLQVVATFFLVGRRASAYPGIVERILTEGHAVGSHSNTHPDPWLLPLRALHSDYQRGRREVERAAGRSVSLFRPPKGHIDAAGAVAIAAAGVRPWLWTIDPGDWQPDVRPEDLVTRSSELHGGDVVLLHDGIMGPLAPSALDRTATRLAIAPIVKLARERQLRFVTLT
jgi:peptidoglycan/xylan/chitin deacetylase (PgdA/CDA1 family)